MNRRIRGSAVKALLIEMALVHRRREQEAVHVDQLKRRNQELEKTAAMVANRACQPRSSADGQAPERRINEGAAKIGEALNCRP